MEIAISGEGDVPTKRCGVTMKLTSDMAEAYDGDWFDNNEVQTYLEGATFVDNEYTSQTVVGTPITTADEHTYAPIVLGITKGLYDHIVELKQGGEVAFSIITEDDEYTLNKPFLYTDGEGNYALLGLLAVDAENTTQLSNDDWNNLFLEIYGGDSEEYVLATDTSISPDVIEFTPAEQSENNG